MSATVYTFCRYCSATCGIEVTVDDEEYLIMKEEDVLAIIE